MRGKSQSLDSPDESFLTEDSETMDLDYHCFDNIESDDQHDLPVKIEDDDVILATA